MTKNSLNAPAAARRAPSIGIASDLGSRFVVAIPVKDEEERLPACFGALARQRDELGRPIAPTSVRIVAFANNCSDGSAALARSLARRLRLDVRVAEATLPPSEAHAGSARRAAMNLAETWLRASGYGDGVLMTTDADSRVPQDWIACNLAGIDAGADAVLGRVALDEDGALLPAELHRRGALEDAYETLLTRLSALLDPVEWNPWPHHSTISGASLALTVRAYQRVGGVPCVPLGEDKALIAKLVCEDARIRFAAEIEVVTSGRVNGRAPGGVADTLRLRSADPHAFCDDALEPIRIALKRAAWKGRLRRLHQSGGLSEIGRWCGILGLSREEARRIARAATFGLAWSIAEQASPMLRRRRLTPADLPCQIGRAHRALARFRRLSTGKHVEPKQIISIPTDDGGGRRHQIDEELSGVVTA
jgi:hypothetical protein